MIKIVSFFDKLEDKIRARLSRKPILYAIIGGVAVVLFWRGVWILTDQISFWLTGKTESLGSAMMSIVVSIAILLASGLFVSFFIGDIILMSGIKKEKKLVEKTEEEIASEADALSKISKDIAEIKRDVEEIKEQG